MLLHMDLDNTFISKQKVYFLIKAKTLNYFNLVEINFFQ